MSCGWESCLVVSVNASIVHTAVASDQPIEWTTFHESDIGVALFSAAA